MVLLCEIILKKAGIYYENADIFYTFASQLRPGSLVNRASDSGSEGRGFESHPGHKQKIRW